MTAFDWGRDRRRSARVDLLAEFQGHVLTLDESVQVRQISDGGLTVETTAPLSPRVTHEFRLTIGDDTALVRARVNHTRVQVRDDVVSYLSGLVFEEPSAEAHRVIAEIIDLVQAAQRDPGQPG